MMGKEIEEVQDYLTSPWSELKFLPGLACFHQSLQICAVTPWGLVQVKALWLSEKYLAEYISVAEVALQAAVVELLVSYSNNLGRRWKVKNIAKASPAV